ncbi:MAG TPA: glycosyltransferase [Nevskiaceae bacterium]|nr:glycosyltransferase [Nevskiaceae bacterium]
MFDSSLAKAILVYIPISAIGLWRWTFWIIRRVAASLYRPNVGQWPADYPKPKVSIVSPVYNEDPALFEEAIQSWIKNGVDEIIIVIDKTNVRHIVDYERRYASNKKLATKCRMIVTPKPGKRAALCDGIEQATGDLIAVVDSDTIWSDDVLEKTLPYFLNPRVGGATLTQRVKDPDNIATIIFDIMLWSRYQEEVPALLGVGKAFNTLSGRTAFYRREAIFADDHDNIHHLRHEFFLGTRGISGDDKRLTHLILSQGWHVAYVVGPTVYTSGMRSIKQFMKQRLRWTRNMWRGDLRAISQGWIWKHPALAIFRIDSFVQPFLMLIGPVALTIALISQEWLVAGILVAWWIFSRTVKLFGYFRAHPQRFIYLPAYIIYSYINAVVKIYALATLVEHSWATRWHQSRMKAKKLFRRWATVGVGVLAIVGLFGGLTMFVMSARAQSAADVAAQAPVETAAFTNDIDFASKAPLAPKVPTGITMPSGVQRYTVQRGDTLSDIAARTGMDLKALKKLNGLRDPDLISAGQVLLYYQQNGSAQ